jgi:hypothetical protein
LTVRGPSDERLPHDWRKRIDKYRDPASLTFVKSRWPPFGKSHNHVTFVVAGFVACLLWAAPAVSEPLAYDTPEWRKEIAQGYFPYHRLARADFPVVKQTNSKWAMYTAGFLHYNYRNKCHGEHPVVARVTEWKVRSGFNRNRSWRNSWFKDAERLLPHEQGHLDINELHSRRLARIDLDELPTGKGETSEEAVDDLNSKLKAFSTQAAKDNQAEQESYDAKTSHGKNDSRQKEATAALQERLRQAGINYANKPSSVIAEPTGPLDVVGRTLKTKR